MQNIFLCVRKCFIGPGWRLAPKDDSRVKSGERAENMQKKVKKQVNQMKRNGKMNLLHKQRSKNN